MHSRTLLASIAGGAFVWMGSIGSAGAAQHGHHVHHHGRLPAYDTATESTIEGAIDELVILDRVGCSGCEGSTHVFLSGQEIEIHLCPSGFLESKGCHLREGDALRVTGSKLLIGGSSILVAREVHCGDGTVMLRDEIGRPLWSQPER